MKLLFLILLYVLSFTKSKGQTVLKNFYGQIKVEITKERNPRRIYAKVECAPSVPIEDSSLIASLERNINQTLKFRNGAKKGKYVVLVRFILSKDGYISDVICEQDPGFGMSKIVINAVKRMSLKWAKWIPASQEGRTVKEYRH